MGDIRKSACVTVHTFKHICSLLLVHRPKGVLLVLIRGKDDRQLLRKGEWSAYRPGCSAAPEPGISGEPSPPVHQGSCQGQNLCEAKKDGQCNSWQYMAQRALGAPMSEIEDGLPKSLPLYEMAQDVRDSLAGSFQEKVPRAGHPTTPVLGEIWCKG